MNSPRNNRTHLSLFSNIRTILIILSLIYPVSCAEDKIQPLLLGILKGTIVSKTTGNPIENVQVITAPVTTAVFTDAQGVFILPSVPEGDYTVLTNIDGYARESIKVKVLRNSPTELTIKLSATTLLAPSPKNPVPATGSVDLPLSVTLKWSLSRASEDSLKYTVAVYEANNILPITKVENLRDTLLVLNNLKNNTTYFWQVDVLSSTGYITSGELWLFKTIPFPDNEILFASKKDGNYEIYSATSVGDVITRITNTSGYELHPLYSSNRKIIAYSSNAEIDYHIYTMNQDGTAVQQVTTLPIAGYHNQGIGFCWSPDDGKLVYSHYDKLYRIDKDGTNLTLIANAKSNRNFRTCDWTAINNKIVVETVGPNVWDSEIYLMNANGTDTVRIVDNLPGIIESPSFSIDGQKVLFTRDVSGFESESGRQLDAHILLLNLATKQISDLSTGKPNGTNDLEPRFSPNGSKIIFVNESNDGSGFKTIWAMDASGGNRQKIIDNGEMPSWQ